MYIMKAAGGTGPPGKDQMKTETMLYAQSGGVTAVINATAAAVIATARRHGVRVLGARNGILGVLREELFDTASLNRRSLADLAATPGGVFGSCRFKLRPPEEDPRHYERLVEVLRAHQVRWFLYNGGNDSADTALKLSRISRKFGHELVCVGVPKTVDNDLALTDNCPGFGSIARYTATSVREAALDVQSMMETSTNVFVMEVMGRNAGWVAAASALAGAARAEAPHLILFPERAFDLADFLARVRATVNRHGHCVVVASEGIRDAAGNLLAESGMRDAFGHAQLGGVAPRLAEAIHAEPGLKCHWAVPDYLQRSARHLASATDLDQARAVGEEAVALALAGANGMMPVIVRDSDQPYRWHLEPAPLARIANREKKLPAGFISRDGYGITARARRYLEPLIVGQAPVAWEPSGLPRHVRPDLRRVAQQLPPFTP